MCMAEVCEGLSDARCRGPVSAPATRGPSSPAARWCFPGCALPGSAPTDGRSSSGERRGPHDLLDPYLAGSTPGSSGAFDPATPPADPALIDKHIPTAADHILIGHGHWDPLGATKKYTLPGHLLSDPPAPTVAEGDTFCYLLSIDDGPSVVLMSTANVVERAFARDPALTWRSPGSSATRSATTASG